jgi:hypothetical protein
MTYRIDYLDNLRQAGVDQSKFTAVFCSVAVLPLGQLRAIAASYTGAALDYRTRQDALNAILDYPR